MLLQLYYMPNICHEKILLFYFTLLRSEAFFWCGLN